MFEGMKTNRMTLHIHNLWEQIKIEIDTLILFLMLATFDFF